MIIFFIINLGYFFLLVIKGLQCQHENSVTRTIYSSINCETTTNFCKDCGKQITEAITDCR